MPTFCAMRDCTSGTDKERSFFGFPADETRCKAWVQACGRPELYKLSHLYLYKNSHLCDRHFRRCDRLSKKLKPNAIPLAYNQVPMDDQSTQTDVDGIELSDSDEDTEEGPKTSTAANKKGDNNKRPATMGRQLDQIRMKIKRLHDNKQGTVKTDFFTVIDLQVELKKLSNYKSCARKLQLYALRMYLSSPTTYGVIRGSLDLPSEKVLRRTNLDIDTAMSENVTKCLKYKMKTLEKKERYCTVCLKKMPLKRFLFYHINKDKVIGFQNLDGEQTMTAATHAYVLLARGLCAKWEQPLAYCFIDENQNIDINPWIDGVIVNITKIGYNVVALVVDHEDLYDHFRSRILSFTQPFFFIDGKKVFCLFDLPQLIISLRNTLMTHELQFLDDNASVVIADWGTIRSLYEGCSDDYNCIRVPKLTKAHINPNESQKKELKYAAQVFSKSVSEALIQESKRRVEYDCRLRGTQKLTALVNDVFDILNSSAYNHHNKCKNAFTGEPYQMKAIREFMEFLTNVKPNDCFFEDASFNCIYGLRITIMSFSIILRDLLPMGITSLVTHRFNMDAVNRVLDSVKEKSKCKKPTPVQFYKYFRRIFMFELMKPPKTGRRPDNLSDFLNNVNFNQLKFQKMRTDEFQKTLEVSTVDYRFEIPSRDAFQYVYRYLWKKCFLLHKCGLMERLNPSLSDTDLASYDWETNVEPPHVFVEYIKTLNNEFDKLIGHRLEIGLGTGILLILNERKFELLCSCFPVSYLRRLFVRMRIFQIIRYNNRNLRDESFCFTTTDNYNVDNFF